MDAIQFRQAAHAAIEESTFQPFYVKAALTSSVIAYYENIAENPVIPLAQPGYLIHQIPAAAPQHAEPWSQIQSDIATKILPGLPCWQSPRFMAFFLAGKTYPSILGEIYSAAFRAPWFDWICSPAYTELETIVMDWLARALSLPSSFLSTSPTGGGVIHGSASEAIIMCMVAARERFLSAKCNKEGLLPGTRDRAEREAYLRTRLVALSSDQLYASTKTGARIVGTRHLSIPVAISDDLSLTGASLQDTLKECQRQGWEPFFITLAFGAASTCSVDDFTGIGPILQGYPEIWIHVDAACAGAALICPEYSSEYRDLFSPVDSFNMSPHWLLMNLGASCTFVKDRTILTQAIFADTAYDINEHIDAGLVPDLWDWEIGVGRRFQALKMWFVIRTHGIKSMQEHIRRTIKLGQMFATLIRSRTDLFEIITKPAFALTCFRVRVPGPATSAISAFSDSSSNTSSVTDIEPDVNDQAANELTREVLRAIIKRGQYFFAGSSAGETDFIRVVSANVNCEKRHVREAFKLIVRITEEVLAPSRIFYSE